MVISHKRGHLFNGSLVISVDLHCQTWTVKCKIWILASMKLCLPRKKGNISQTCHFSLVVDEWRIPVQKIAKISNSEVRERNNFPFDEHVGAGNQLQQDTLRPGIKEDSRRYKDKTDILQYCSYCNLFLSWYSKFEARGNEDVDRLSDTCLPQDYPWALLIKQLAIVFERGFWSWG